MTGPRLSIDTCMRRLAPLEEVLSTTPAPVEAEISWCGIADFPSDRRWSEATVQAVCGLMEVHGWDTGEPRRVGLEVASVAAGMLAASGVLAARTGALRGLAPPRVHTSVLSAGLLLVAHHIAAATSEGELLPSPQGPEPGPPFLSADGRWFEIEVFDAEDWKSFWARLGAPADGLGRAWTAFRARYYRGLCSLPPGLHAAAGTRTLAQISEAAAASGVSLCALRGYAEVLENPGPSGGRPVTGRWHGYAPSPGTAAAPTAEAQILPLHGIKVVEATSRMQGPLAGLILQWLGAEVLRVEPPGGDPGRMVPPIAGDTGSFFACYNRSKRAVEVDLGRPSGRHELLDLLATADVFVHNWRPGKATEWGLDAEGVAVANPRIVHTEASGWYPVEGNAGLIGTDFLVQAWSGFAHGLTPEGEPPRTSRALLTDTLGALATCEGILTGLFLREVTGRAEPVRTSLLQAAMAAQAHVLEPLAGGGDAPGRRGGRPAWGPVDRPIVRDDGALVVSIESDDDLARVADVCGVVPSTPTVAEALATRPAAEWEERLLPAGVACAVVSNDLVTVGRDPRLAYLMEPLAGSCVAPGLPWWLAW